MSIVSTLTAALSPKQAERLQRNAAFIDSLHAAEANAAKGEQQVLELETRVTALEREHAELLADAVESKITLDVAAAKRAELEAARTELADARKAHGVLVERLEAAKREQLANATAEFRKALARKCMKRLDLVRKYQDIEKERGRLWRALHEANELIGIAFPGGSPPLGGMTDGHSLRIAFEREAYRQNANPPLYGGQQQTGVPTIPGAKCDDLSLLGLPEKLPSFAQAISEANEYLLTMLDRNHN